MANMTTTSEAYLDIGGVERTWPRSYDGCIKLECDNCHAPILELCINPITGRPRKTPCVARLARPMAPLAA